MPDRPPTALATSAIDCQVSFGAPGRVARAAELVVALPVLAGPSAETILRGGLPPETAHECTFLRTADELAGFVVAPPGLDLEAAARELYRRVFAATGTLRLCRVWNYVPGINAVTGDLENYRWFCRGRSVAFEENWGRDFQRELPAASAVGTESGPLAVAFLATRATPRHFENPRQIPAFEYPPDYGPRPPSFSRATLAVVAGQKTLFLSGTAAIRGHATVAPDDLGGQLSCTLENLGVIAQTAGAGADVGRADGWRRTFKVYLRHRDELERARTFLERHLFSPADTVTYLQAGICRADLRVEIEAVLTR